MWMHVDKWYFQVCSHRPIKQLSFRGSDTDRHEVIRMWSPTRMRCLEKCLTCWHQNGGNGRVVPHNDLTKSAHLDNWMEEAYKYIQSFRTGSMKDRPSNSQIFTEGLVRLVPHSHCTLISTSIQALPNPSYWRFTQKHRPLFCACLVYGLMNLSDSEGRPSHLIVEVYRPADWQYRKLKDVLERQALEVAVRSFTWIPC